MGSVGKVIAGLILSVCASVSWAQDFPHSLPVSPDLRDVAVRTAEALSRADFATLASLAEHSDGFDPRTEDGSKTYEAYFTTSFKSIDGQPPLAGLIAGDEVMSRVFVESESSATAYFIPKRFVKDSLSDEEFFDKMFMKKYFACDFVRLRDEWKISGACFAGTSGPFPGDIG